MNTPIISKVIVLFLILQTLLSAYTLTGKVVSVTDGDTIKLLTTNNILYKIRLEYIDAPEKSQAFGKKSKNNLSKLLARKIVNVHYEKKDRYGRILGIVYTGDIDMNLRQIEDGYAWVYRRYCDRKDYSNAEEYAKSKKLGLWHDKYPKPPWDYRHRKQHY